MYIDIVSTILTGFMAERIKNKFETYRIICYVSGEQYPHDLGVINVPKGTDISEIKELLNAHL